MIGQFIAFMTYCRKPLKPILQYVVCRCKL